MSDRDDTIRRLRAEGLSLREIARRVGMSPMGVQKVLRRSAVDAFADAETRERERAEVVKKARSDLAALDLSGVVDPEDRAELAGILADLITDDGTVSRLAEHRLRYQQGPTELWEQVAAIMEPFWDNTAEYFDTTVDLRDRAENDTNCRDRDDID
jgi:transcriptional regulator with XRE-family HTH domain